MKKLLTPSKIKWFTLFKLPSVYFMGVRVKSLSQESCIVTVRHRWLNQNPFKSMFWAVQGMAAELSTGALVMQCIQQSDQKISMLVANNKATFSKKARGRITFTCHDGNAIARTIQTAIKTKTGETLWMTAIGVDEVGDQVSQFQFQWTVKVK